MEKTATEIFAPVYAIIKKMQKADENEKELLMRKLFEINNKAAEEFNSLDKEFEKIEKRKVE